MKIGTFTGKKDLNGKKICNGDFVELVFAHQVDGRMPKESYGVYKVEWSNRQACFNLRVIRKNWLDSAFRTKEEARKTTIDPRCPAISILTQPLGRYNICRIIDYRE